MRLYVGIDDTDNLDSRGTGHRARQLAAEIDATGIGAVRGVTRHQLLVDPAIPYTSHNSAACLAVDAAAGGLRPLADLCRVFLLRESAPGSDAGLCVADDGQARAAADYGRAAQTRVLTQDDARAQAAGTGALLEGLTGTRGGIIGALAGVALHVAGEDGRYLWLRGIRDVAHLRLPLAEVRRRTDIDVLARVDGRPVEDPDAPVDLGPWPRPVRIGGQAVLLVEEDPEAGGWRVLAKERVKKLRP